MHNINICIENHKMLFTNMYKLIIYVLYIQENYIVSLSPKQKLDSQLFTCIHIYDYEIIFLMR
jgi:hypothetical protein